jgi:radical SAM protein with 4Fe4S-binding SPASM domain
LNRKTEPPRIISWNITLQCPLKCSHCYADAGAREAEGVLNTDEAFGVIDQIRATGTPLVILSGGEPLMRGDICAIARYGTEQGLRMALGTSGFFIDTEMAAHLSRAGIRAAAISLDSDSPAVHDAFRGTDGAWDRAVQAIRHCRDAGIHVQINMSVMNSRADEVDRVVRLGRTLGVRDYQLFFPVPTGRSRLAEPRSPQEYEKMIRQVLLRYRDSDMNIRPTCAPQFRRIADEAGIKNPAWGRGCIAGISYCRIYANGDVTPCPYLPVSAGNVRTGRFSDIWYNSSLFLKLHNPENLGGKCGRCNYRTVCGGCRARAYRGADAFSTGGCGGREQPGILPGDVSGEDPWCPYEPCDGAA